MGTLIDMKKRAKQEAIRIRPNDSFKPASSMTLFLRGFL